MEHPSVSRQSTADAHPLLVFFDIETTGLSIYNECITEIAAKVVGDPVSTVTKAVYTSLVHATKSIPPEVQELTGINNDMLKEERPLSIVLPEFLKWLVDTAKEASDENTVYYPVLVAHNGFSFDYPLLMAEIKRTPEISFQSLKESNIHFADTLPHLRKAKKEGHAALAKVQKFGLRNLYCHFVQHKYIAHRALPDVEAMEELFASPALHDLLSSLPKRSATEQIHKYVRHQKTRKVLHSFHRKITTNQAERLVDLNLTYNDLLEIKWSCSKEEFLKKVSKKGVRSKNFTMKLFSILPGSPAK